MQKSKLISSQKRLLFCRCTLVCVCVSWDVSAAAETACWEAAPQFLCTLLLSNVCVEAVNIHTLCVLYSCQFLHHWCITGLSWAALWACVLGVLENFAFSAARLHNHHRNFGTSSLIFDSSVCLSLIWFELIPSPSRLPFPPLYHLYMQPHSSTLFLLSAFKARVALIWMRIMVSAAWMQLFHSVIDVAATCLTQNVPSSLMLTTISINACVFTHFN